MPSSPVILLVDDDENDVLFLRRALRQAGVTREIRVVHDGEAAVAYLSGRGEFADREAHPLPCLIVLDLKLPKRNGLEVLHWLRGQKGLSGTPVVMVTSSGEAHDQQAAEAQGVEAYRIKPVSFQELVRLAREIRVEVDDHCGPG
jgi:CheY-like chemotaxis protein